jgi:methionine-rich copper-binding protein CopC
MKVHRFIVAVAAACAPLLTLAHSTTTSTTPANGAVLKAAPAEFMLMFNAASKVTKLTLQKKGDAEEQKLGPLSGDATQHFAIAAPKLGPGETLRYEPSGDNHIVRHGDFDRRSRQQPVTPDQLSVALRTLSLVALYQPVA